MAMIFFSNVHTWTFCCTHGHQADTEKIIFELRQKKGPNFETACNQCYHAVQTGF